ncbi:hypothetical protein M405DRAFT_866095 [Rhizopogon salebrosus TDB-379]|nr:hypothetical protein M405DRAFT_866095 [Rhizopogon salebrosus TDB-379]
MHAISQAIPTHGLVIRGCRSLIQTARPALWKNVVERWLAGDPDGGLKTPLKAWPKEWYQGANRRFASKYYQGATIALGFVNEQPSSSSHPARWRPLLTPAGQFEDPTIITNNPKAEETPKRGRKSKLSIATSDVNPTSASSVFIYSRANFARPPIAQLPGHEKASVAVKSSPVLYELRQDVVSAEGQNEPKTGTLEKGKDGSISLDIAGSSTALATHKDALAPSPKVEKNPHQHVEAPTPRSLAPEAVVSSSSLKAPTPSPSKPSTPAITPPNTGSVFSLPYLYAVLTMDAVAIYDTQQSGPVCMLTKLHYDEFTDALWSPDGQCLILSSRDGYCTIVIFDEILPTHHTQQYALQLQSIAQHNFVPLTYTMTPSSSSTALPAIATPTVPAKRSEPHLTPALSIDDNAPTLSACGSASEAQSAQLAHQPPTSSSL